MGRRVVGVVAAVVAAALVAGMAVTQFGGSEEAVECVGATEDQLAQTVSDSLKWMQRSVGEDNRYWYEYDRSTDTFSDDYNVVRHAGVTMSIYQIAALGGGDGDVDPLEVGDRGRQYILENLVTVGERTAFVAPGGNAELGSTALAVAALVHRRMATGDATDDDLLESMGRFMVSLIRDDGGMLARGRGVDLEPVEGTTSTFFTGEAFWAFGLLANELEDDIWRRHARQVGHYLATERDAEEKIENPPHPDQWAAYGFSEMRSWAPLEGEELDYVRALIERYHGRIEREIKREANRVGDGSGPPDESVRQARGAAFGTTVEALGSLWRLSLADEGLADLEPQLRADLTCAAAILHARQNTDLDAGGWPRPEAVAGAWFYEDITRMDDQQHAMSGVQLAIDAMKDS